MNRSIVFLCGARDFHAMDWYRSALDYNPSYKVLIITDLIAGEGYKKLINGQDKVYKLLVLDKWLFSKQSLFGHIWRNFLKLLVFPVQVMLLKKLNNQLKPTIYHAHSMYYLVLARAAGVVYVGTPQGSDVLVKPFKSFLFKWFAKYGLQKAKSITVDSYDMMIGIKRLVNRDAIIIQNGIDIQSIENVISTLKFRTDQKLKEGVLSVRGFTPLYRIKEILKQKAKLNSNINLTLIYPFSDENYRNECTRYLQPTDKDLGRVDRDKMYELMYNSKLVISVPSSDSSPRSVYEAIFCGAPVAITYNNYFELLPKCMKDRIVIVDFKDPDWLENSIIIAQNIMKNEFVPDKESLELFDQRKSFKKIEKILFS